MVRRAGENIACSEVESVAAGHDQVQMCAVTPVPDPILGEEVKIHVELVSGVEPSAEVALSIVDFISAHIAQFKVPRYVEFVDEFPLTPSERVAKPQLMARKLDQRQGSYRVENGRADLWDETDVK